MGWKHWHKLASRYETFNDGIVYEGPAVYELAVMRRYGKYISAVYVGETSNLQRRMYDYARNGSHLWS